MKSLKIVYLILLFFVHSNLISSHRYGLEYIGCVCITIVIEGAISERPISCGGKNTRFAVASTSVCSTLRGTDTGVLQNVRGSSQVRL